MHRQDPGDFLSIAPCWLLLLDVIPLMSGGGGILLENGLERDVHRTRRTDGHDDVVGCVLEPALQSMAVGHGVPHLAVVRNGEVVLEMVGGHSLDQLKARLRSIDLQP